MTMTLPVKIQMRRGQTALSFASCVAAANGAPSLRNFCREKHVHYHQLVGGSERAFRHLSEYAGISVRDLFAAHPRRIDRMFEIHGERLSYKSFRLRTRVICPKCLLDDADKEPGPPQSRPFGRISWLSTSARVCPLHQLTLVPLDGDIRDFSNDLAALVKYRQPTLLKLARKADAFGSPFDAYVHDRLNGIQTAKCHYLDQFSFHLAAGMTEAVGAQDMFGSSTLFGKLDLRTQIVAANRGFSILSSGNDGLRNHLTTLVNEFWQTDKPRPGTKLYGTLYRYLNGEPDTVAGIPQSVMADHAIQTLPLPTSFYMFGREIERRYLSLLSASAELGFPRGKLKSFNSTWGSFSAAGSSGGRRARYSRGRRDPSVAQINCHRGAALSGESLSRHGYSHMGSRYLRPDTGPVD